MALLTRLSKRLRAWLATVPGGGELGQLLQNADAGEFSAIDVSGNADIAGIVTAPTIRTGTTGPRVSLSADEEAATATVNGGGSTSHVLQAQGDTLIETIIAGSGEFSTGLPANVADAWSITGGGDLMVFVTTAGVRGVLMAARALGTKGADVASAGTITLGEGNYFDITGTTTINYITTTGWTAGSEVILQFDASVTVAHNTGSVPANTAAILLASAGNLSATANDTLKLVYDGVTWRETGRAVI